MLSLSKAEMFKIIATQFPLLGSSEDADQNVVQPAIEALQALVEDLPIMADAINDNIHIRLKNAVRKQQHELINEEALTEIVEQVYQEELAALKKYPKLNATKEVELRNIIVTAMVQACAMYQNKSASESKRDSTAPKMK